MPNDHRGRDVHGGKVTDDEIYSFSVDDILGAFDPYQETKLRTLGYEQDETFPPGPRSRFSTKDGMSDITVPEPPSDGDWPVVRKENRHFLGANPVAYSTHSLGRLPDGSLPDGRTPEGSTTRTTSGETMEFWNTWSPGGIRSEGVYRTPYRAALAAAAMAKRAADPTRNLRTGRKMDNV